MTARAEQSAAAAGSDDTHNADREEQLWTLRVLARWAESPRDDLLEVRRGFAIVDACAWRLLIVDESPEWRAELARRFAERGYLYRCAADAREARVAVLTFDPHGILFDWVFHDATGVGLAAQLRQDAATRGRTLRIVALSAWEEPYEFCRREMIDSYFVKPSAIAEIERAIRAGNEGNRARMTRR